MFIVILLSTLMAELVYLICFLVVAGFILKCFNEFKTVSSTNSVYIVVIWAVHCRNVIYAFFRGPTKCVDK